MNGRNKGEDKISSKFNSALRGLGAKFVAAGFSNYVKLCTCKPLELTKGFKFVLGRLKKVHNDQ